MISLRKVPVKCAIPLGQSEIGGTVFKEGIAVERTSVGIRG
jgi:hypothetical protein